MKRFLITAMLFFGIAQISLAQKIEFTEYKLDNGLHVILQQDNSAPLVNVSVMYHVGGKNDLDGKAGFAHFFEHLLFEGSDNIARGQFFKLVSEAGGRNNAYTSNDVTFYYETLPSNELETGLWLESERMMHPKIDTIGVETQRGVIKEEIKQTRNSRPYGQLWDGIFSRLFKQHNYKSGVIGTPEDLDRVVYDDVNYFFKKYYGPANACLVIAGDIDVAKTKQLVQAYFGPVKASEPVPPYAVRETKELGLIVDTIYDANIQIPLVLNAFLGPRNGSKESYALQMACDVLGGGKSARLVKKMVDEKKTAIQVSCSNQDLEDYSIGVFLALPNGDQDLNGLFADMNDGIKDIQTNLISDKEYQKLMKQYEVNAVNGMTGVQGIGTRLSYGYTFHKNTNLINEELALLQSITKEDLRNAARTYLNPNNKLVIYYLPTKK